MNIQLFEPHLARERGFFRYLFLALQDCKGARFVAEPRPAPRITKPREHVGAWARFDGHLVFFDMSDHAFLFDLEAVRRGDVYFKVNSHPAITRKVLQQADLLQHAPKVLPFVWFAGNLEAYRPDAWANRLRVLWPTAHHDVCHVVGVYENLVRDGERSVFAADGPEVTPSRYHFWIRYHIQETLKTAGIRGYYRLTSRGNHALEDGRLVLPNLSERAFMQKMLASRFTVINILPHALLPWKASESLALGRPLVIERTPLVETPEPFRLKPDIHYLELLPGEGAFDDAAELNDPRGYRVLQKPDLNRLLARAEWLATVLKDTERCDYMTEQARRYSRDVLQKNVVADFVCERVYRALHQ